jgi:hypothetical protein
MGNNISEEKIEQALALFIKEDLKINGNTIAKYLGCSRSNIANNYPKELVKIDIAMQEQKKNWEHKKLSDNYKKLLERHNKLKKVTSGINKSTNSNEVTTLLSHINSLYCMYDDMRARYENVSALLIKYKEKHGKID